MIHNLYILIDQICRAGAIFRRIIKRDLTDRQTERLTDELIWGGLGNLWFLQVKFDYITTLPPPPPQAIRETVSPTAAAAFVTALPQRQR